MAAFGEESGSASPPVAGRKDKRGNGFNLETQRQSGSVSNGNCAMTDSRTRSQNDTNPGSPRSESPGLDVETTKPIPRRSSLIKDGSRAGRDRKKNVSFSSSLSERKISSAADCIHAMVEGSELRKVRSNSRVYQRYYLLDAGLQALSWEPSKKESGKARISVPSIREVRTGRNTETFRTSGVYDQISEDCAFSIVFGEMYETLDLVANSAEVANVWVTGLRYMMQNGKHTLDMLASSQDSLRLTWLGKLFASAVVADAKGDPTEDEEEGIPLGSAVRLIQSANPAVSNIKVEHRLKELQRLRERTDGAGAGAGGRDGAGAGAGTGTGPSGEVADKDHNDNDQRRVGRKERVTKSEFIEVFRDICTRPEIYFLLVQFSSNKEFLDTKDLMRFLEAEQGVAQVTDEAALELIQSHEPSEDGRHRGCLSLDGFTSYLRSPECHLFDGEHGAVCQDMTQPLSHYYINSSHNTYLIEDQFRGPSDVTGYIRALKMGCRCVEVDVWDGPDDEPLVYTGHTLTTPVAFRSVLDAIGRFAFAASEYPLIVCVENHCSLRQQRVMLQHLGKILGDKLYTDPPAEDEWYLPSPHSLRGRIILKGRKLETGWEGEDGEISDEDEGADMGQKKVISSSGESGGGGGGGGGGVRERKVSTSGVAAQHPPPPPPKRFQLLKGLSDTVTLCRSIRFVDFQTSLAKQRPWELCSFNEALALRLASEHPGKFVNHNKRLLSRVHPSPMRLDSTNMNPQDLWKCGCQMVAMNYQTAGLMMDLNTGWFRQNGNCGYVLRPAIMRQEVSFFSADTRDTVPGVSPQLLHVKVISGQSLPRPRGSGVKGDVVDPYVYVEIHGIPADCAERRTRTVIQNGDNPIFDESFEFKINLPELAIVRFVVLDDDFIGDEFIGQYTIPLECLQPGYRNVPLQSLTGEDLPHARLFVHVALTNRRGGGKPHKRGLSVRKARRGRDYTALRDLGVRAIDEVFKMADPALREATDLRENMQNSVVLFRELCGVSAVANMMQCVLALSSWVAGPDGAPLLLFRLRDQYPALEPQGPLPEVLRKAVFTYDTMVQASRAVIEHSDGVYDRMLHIQTTAMEFHEKLQSMASKEGLKGRKISRAVENFSWNMTILKGQAHLLKDARAEVLDNMKQVHCAALTSNLTTDGAGAERPRSQSRRSLEALPEDCTTDTAEG